MEKESTQHALEILRTGGALVESDRERRWRIAREVGWWGTVSAVIVAGAAAPATLGLPAVIALGGIFVVGLGRVLGQEMKHALGFGRERAAWDKVELGRFDDIAALYESIARTAKRRDERLEAVLNLAYLAKRQGQLDDAIAGFREVVMADPGSHPSYRACIELAACLALCGDIVGARAQLARGDRYVPSIPSAEAIVSCRAGELSRVLRMRPQVSSWPRSHLRHDHRVLALLKAFAADSLPLESGRDPAQRDEVVDRNLAMACPVYAGEHDYLVERWPELRDFVAAHPWDVATRGLPRARLLERKRRD